MASQKKSSRVNTANDAKLKVDVSQIIMRDASQTECQRFKKRIPDYKIDALKKIHTILTDCIHPWYIIGSVAFLVNAKESKKQSQDIDIIFNEEDIERIEKELKQLNFKKEISKITNCTILIGEILIEKNNKTHKIPIELFAQNTIKPNGIINPGAKNTKYEIIKLNYQNQEYLMMGIEGQRELYFKNLVLELNKFNLHKLLEKLERRRYEIKSEKFINRLANLFELSENNSEQMLTDIKKYAKNTKEKNTLKLISNLTNQFNKLPRRKIQKKDNLQEEIEKLKQIIKFEIHKIVEDYYEIKKEKTTEVLMQKSTIRKLIKKTSQEQSKITQKTLKKIKTKQKETNQLLKIYSSEISYKPENLPIYIFLKIFEENFIKPFSDEILKILKK